MFLGGIMEDKKKKIIIGVVGVVVLIAVTAVLAVMSAKRVVNDASEISSTESEINASEEPISDEVEDVKSESTKEQDNQTITEEYSVDMDKTFARMTFLGDEQNKYNEIEAKVPTFTIENDLSNIINASDFEWCKDDFREKLVKNQFVVVDGGAREFFEIYEMNRYMQRPNFVTVDSMMHSYHLFFSYLLKSIEKKSLYDDLCELSEGMLRESINQYEEVKGYAWEDAAKRNVAFFAVGCKLLGLDVSYPSDVNTVVDEELALIAEANGIDESPLMANYEDYSQYTVRGYYEGDETLEKYFRAMMWYGRIHFLEENEDMDRSALLMNLALLKDNVEKWESIYSVTAFFAGASDDLIYYDYMPVICEVYGNDIKLNDIVNDTDKWQQFHDKTGKLNAPRINSIPIEDGEDNVILGYRFMGQRFSIDATIMQELVYSRVGENEKEDKRMLPDALDVPAALGSDEAFKILESSGATSYENYVENLDKLKDEFNNDDGNLWKASLYAGWLNTLRPLLVEKKSGYPEFMQSKEWVKKTLETFAGSYTELKHDTILYSKQIMAEMGGGWDDEIDDRGYVEPEPLVYARFSQLATDTIDGLKKYGYITSDDEINLANLAKLSDSLCQISVKELNNELLTEEEYDLIRDYGGQLEHLWIEIMRAQTGEEYPSTDQFPAAIVVDVATDPNGSVLELGTGSPASIYVAVMIDGDIRICEGAAYSFYQFEQPISDRLTDSKWRRMLGVEIDIEEEDPYADIVDVPHPDWANGYRYVIKYEY